MVTTSPRASIDYACLGLYYDLLWISCKHQGHYYTPAHVTPVSIYAIVFLLVVLQLQLQDKSYSIMLNITDYKGSEFHPHIQI